MEPTVAIVIPIYNVELYVKKCLESVIAQTYNDFEVIVVNDGSTDDSRRIAEETINGDKRFRIIDQNNKGLGGARNTGIHATNADYIIQIDSDDWLEKEYVERMIDVARKYNADVVMCSYYNVRENAPITHFSHKSFEEHLIKVEEKEEYLRTVRYVTWNKMIRTSMFENITFPEHMSKQDYATIPRVLSKAKTIVCINDKLYNYLWRETSATNENTINVNLLKAQRILEKSELYHDHPDLLKVYFIRNIMGSLVWSMCINSKDYSNDVLKIIDDELLLFPDLKYFIKDKYIGRFKSFFGNQLIKKNIKTAKAYAIWYSRIQSFARRIKRIIGM